MNDETLDPSKAGPRAKRTGFTGAEDSPVRGAMEFEPTSAGPQIENLGPGGAGPTGPTRRAKAALDAARAKREEARLAESKRKPKAKERTAADNV